MTLLVFYPRQQCWERKKKKKDELVDQSLPPINLTGPMPYSSKVVTVAIPRRREAVAVITAPQVSTDDTRPRVQTHTLRA